MEPITKKQITELFKNETARDLSLPDLESVDWAILDYFGWISHAFCIESQGLGTHFALFDDC